MKENLLHTLISMTMRPSVGFKLLYGQCSPEDFILSVWRIILVGCLCFLSKFVRPFYSIGLHAIYQKVLLFQWLFHCSLLCLPMVYFIIVVCYLIIYVLFGC